MSTPLHDRVVRYLAASGWRAPDEQGSVGELWRHPSSEVVVPVPYQLEAGSLDWQVLMERLAWIEGVAVADVAARFTDVAMDVVNLRAANDTLVRDTIALEAGVTLIQSYWTMLRSSATTAMAPRPFIRRYRKSGDELIAAARMAHTRKGSFIIPILLPLSEPEPDAETAKAEPLPGMGVTAAREPLERRIMRTFADSLAALDSVAIQPSKEPRAAAVDELVRAGVSHQFVNALHRVLTEETVSEFSANFEWAPVGDPPKTVRAVSIPSAASERLRGVASRLRETSPPRTEEQFVGPIRRVERDPGTDTGFVTVQTVRNGHPASIAVPVSGAILSQAWDWARDHITLVVNSKVRRTGEGLIAQSTDAVTPLMLDVESTPHPRHPD